MIQLSELLHALPWETPPPSADPLITGITHDSRQVQPGNLFVALSGGSADGHRYIPDAIERGAAAVVGARALAGLAVPYVAVPDGRQALARFASAFYGTPAGKLTLIGVTGTDGKTTTSSILFAVLQAAGIRVGMISTVSAVIGEQALDTGFHVTTPEAMDVQKYLAQMVEAGLTHAVLEATSHGLDQWRVDPAEFDVALVTNITHEHLDYHGSYEAYRQAKGRLFRGAGQKEGAAEAAVLNRDDSSYEYLKDWSAAPVLTYGFHPQADVRAAGLELTPQGMRFILAGRALDGKRFSTQVETGMTGRFNASNILAAAAVAQGVLELPAEVTAAVLRDFPGVTGRMERIDLGQPFTAIVDFAHTPNALKRLLETTRTVAAGGRVIALFGSAGLRDRQKRRLMAETSAQLADLTVLTAEDPRTEDLDAILAEMAAGAEAQGGVEGVNFWRIPSRAEALRFAVRLAQPGDILLACGKGHEQSMCFGTVEYAWDERTALRAALAEYLGVVGPPMPQLPV